MDRSGCYSGRVRRSLLLITAVLFCIILGTCAEAGVAGAEGQPGDDTDGTAPEIRPSAFFLVTPNPSLEIVTIFQELSFNASASVSNVPGREIARYHWDLYYQPFEGFDPQRTTSSPEKIHTYTRFDDDGFMVGLVVVDTEGVESEPFIRTLWIEDLQGGILAVE